MPSKLCHILDGIIKNTIISAELQVFTLHDKITLPSSNLRSRATKNQLYPKLFWIKAGSVKFARTNETRCKSLAHNAFNTEVAGWTKLEPV